MRIMIWLKEAETKLLRLQTALSGALFNQNSNITIRRPKDPTVIRWPRFSLCLGTVRQPAQISGTIRDSVPGPQWVNICPCLPSLCYITYINWIVCVRFCCLCLLCISSVNSLRPSDACMRQWSNHHWFGWWLVVWPAPGYYLDQCWNIVNWTLGNTSQQI